MAMRGARPATRTVIFILKGETWRSLCFRATAEGRALDINGQRRLNPLGVLSNDPFGCGSLALPCLQELFGQGLQLDWIHGGFNRPGQALLLELLGDRQLNSIWHGRAVAAEPLWPGRSN